MHSYICPHCHAYLDPGEKCDCREEEARKKEQEKLFYEKTIKVEKNGQLCMVM